MIKELSPKEAHKKLRNLILEIDKLLGTVVSQTVTLQPSLLKMIGLPKSTETASIISMARESSEQASELKQLLMDQIESLGILAKAPPGWGAAAVDFMYQIFVNPNAPTDRQEYMEKLRTVDRTMRAKEYQEILKQTKNRYLEIIFQLLSKFITHTENSSDLRKLSMQVASIIATAQTEQVVSTSALQEIFNNLEQLNLTTMQGESFWNKIFIELHNFFANNKEEVKRLEQAKNVIDSAITNLARQKIIPDQVKISQNLALPKFSITPLESFILLNNHDWKNKFYSITHKLTEIIQQTTEKQSTQDTAILYKYFDFVSGLLDPHSEKSIPNQTQKLANTLQELIETIKKNTLSENPTS